MPASRAPEEPVQLVLRPRSDPPARPAPPVDAGALVPPLIAASGRRTRRRFLEYFTARLQSPNTREAYGRAAARFCRWCEGMGFALEDLDPVTASTYIEALRKELSTPSVKQHLSALRNLFDHLVTGNALPFNPFAPVRGPKHVATTGKTAVLDEEDARKLLEGIDTSHVVGLRDKAIISVMVYSFARVGAVVALRRKDYTNRGRQAYLDLAEKGGKFQRVPVHHKAAEALDAYLEAAGIRKARPASPLFRAARGRGRRLENKPLSRSAVLRLVKRRAADAGLPPESVCNHTFRATGITNYMQHGGSLEIAAQIAGHASTRTTQLYNRHAERVRQGEIEKIQI